MYLVNRGRETTRNSGTLRGSVGLPQSIRRDELSF